MITIYQSLLSIILHKQLHSYNGKIFNRDHSTSHSHLASFSQVRMKRILAILVILASLTLAVRSLSVQQEQGKDSRPLTKKSL